MNDVEPTALVAEQGTCLTLELFLLSYDPYPLWMCSSKNSKLTPLKRAQFC
jgi:hypothetical protein